LSAVTFTSTNPGQAAAVADRIASLYVQTHADRQRAEKRIALVGHQFASLKHQLSMAKSDLAER
jgi:uncharacterized protein involved in exopolysaccharide biosynthesis